MLIFSRPGALLPFAAEISCPFITRCRKSVFQTVQQTNQRTFPAPL
jgi:hypothetical protein